MLGMFKYGFFIEFICRHIYALQTWNSPNIIRSILLLSLLVFLLGRTYCTGRLPQLSYGNRPVGNRMIIRFIKENVRADVEYFS